MSRFSIFFINRPIFAMVISIFIILVGLICLPLLPVASMPDLAPPTVAVSADYTGANADVLEESVTQIVEESINGVEDMIYMNSTSSNSGSMSLNISFEVDTDVDMATILTQNRVAVAEPRLPDEVKRLGVTVKKQSGSMVMALVLYSPDDSIDIVTISNYVATQVIDVLSRVNGVSEVTAFGSKDMGMRIWLEPGLLKARNLSVSEVLNALQEQNVQVAAGKLGAPPANENLRFEYAVSTVGRLSTPEEFGAIIIKRGNDGSLLRLRDIARVEIGAQSYSWYAEFNGKSTVALGIYQAPGANALQVANGVKAAMDTLAEGFPKGLKHEVAYDSSDYIRQSVREVIVTLIQAILLVVFSVFIFLHDWRTTLIPSITIPVSLIGTLAVMLALGFSINNLTLFGLILVIGIVVDDAIVVTEGTKRYIDEEGLMPKEATKRAMQDVAGAVIATTLVLLAVFIPASVMPGLTGRVYRPFALTIAVATCFSTLNALTLSPALCGVLLRPRKEGKKLFPFRAFDWILHKCTNGYTNVVRMLIRRILVSLLIFIGLIVLVVLGILKLPTGFIPTEDQGYFFVNAQLPDAASLSRTQKIMCRISNMVLETEGVKSVMTVGGYSIMDGVMGSNSGFSIVSLKHWDERTEPALESGAIVSALQTKLYAITEALVFAFRPPVVQGLGSVGGFQLELQDRGGLGLANLQEVAMAIVAKGYASPIITRMNQNLRATVPQCFIEVDRVKAKRLNVSLSSIFQTLQATLGSTYVNDFNRFGRTWRVMVQGDEKFRQYKRDIEKLYIRANNGNMLPLGTIVSVRDTFGPQQIGRFNLYRSATITGMPMPGYSEGQAVDEIERIVHETMPPTMGFEWSGMTYQQKIAGNLAPIIFGLALLFVYLFLAAQYESWATPMGVMLSVPIAVLGAVGLTLALHLENNIYFQIGLVLLVGLSAKTAVLLVEFSKQLREEGKSTTEAALAAARLRFRAILMTAISFILGVIPLLVATGAGAVSRRSLGTVVFGGMLLSVLLGVFLVPVLDVTVQRIASVLSFKKTPTKKEIPKAR